MKKGRMQRASAASENAVVITSIIIASERRHLDGDGRAAAATHRISIQGTTALEGGNPVSPT